MAHSGRSKETYSSTEESTSNTSSNDSNSTPNTPPSPLVRLAEQPVVPPQPVTPESYNSRQVANGARRTPHSTPTKKGLGAIREDSDDIEPDLPARNPLRRLVNHPRKFFLPAIPTLYGTRDPPKDLYGDVQGPRGEKFSDLRNNSKTPGPRRQGSWRALVCIACVILIIGAAVAIGVIVGLKVRDNKHKAKSYPDDTPNPGNGTPSPVGRYAINSYLIDVNTSCTSNSATWRCAPYETYAVSSSASYSTTNWIINATNNYTYTISSADTTFSYPFQNVPLMKMNNGTEDELWTFTTLFNKTVFPSPPITSNGATVRCFYYNTNLTGQLYTKKPKSETLQNATSSTGGGSNSFQPWPYALDFKELHSYGAGVPDCYTWINGEIGDPISIPISSEYTTLSTCDCLYSNFPS